MVQISIILPVYNGEPFLAETLESIRQQTLRDFEVFCVDDASLDGSAAILEEFAARDQRFKVLRHPANEGSAVKCINTALPECTGAYFFYCSQDDLLSRDCLESLHERALESNADAVLPDMTWYYKTDDNPKQIGPPGGDYCALLSGQQAFILSLDWRIHGFSLRKMDLVKRLGFDDLFTNGDEYATRLFYLNSEIVAFSKGIFHYRQDNEGALTKLFSVKIFDSFGTDVRLLDSMEEYGIHPRHIRRYALGVAVSLRAQQRLLQAQGHELTPAQRLTAERLMDAASCRLELLPAQHRVYVHLGVALRSVGTIRIAVRWLRRLSPVRCSQLGRAN